MSLNTVSKPFSRIDKVPLFYFKSTPVNQPFKPIKRAPNIFESSSILIKTKHPFAEKIKKPLSELEKQACEIRGILNKLSVHNFDKLCKSLVIILIMMKFLSKNWLVFCLKGLLG